MNEPIRLESEEEQCPEGDMSLTVRNTRTRTIITNNGYQKVTEVTKSCREHPEKVFRPQTKLTPTKSKYGFDVLADIGMQRCWEHRQIVEIHCKYKKRGIIIPEKTIETLCQRFLLYLVAVHIENLPKLAMLIDRQGGYVAHVDVTTTKGTPGILLIKDSWSGIRLLAASIPTESSEHMEPYLKEVLHHFGMPIAAIRDMGSGVEAAIAEVFPGIYVISCHYHFLRAIGHRLFDKIYPCFKGRVNRTGVKKKLRTLQKQFKKRKITNDSEKALELLDYLLEYTKDGNGISYPFSLSVVDLYRRCENIRHMVRTAILYNAKNNANSPCLSRLENALNLLKPPPAVRGRIHTEYLKLEERWKWFKSISKALRYRNGHVPLNNDGFLSDKELEKGRKMIDKLLARIDRFIIKSRFEKDRGFKKVLRGISELIKERREELFVPNITVNVNGKQKIRKLPRTNNSAEQDFRSFRRHGRRIRGDSDVERSIQRDGVGLAIMKNFEIRSYVQTVYGSMENMVSRFAEVTPESLEKAKRLFKQ